MKKWIKRLLLLVALGLLGVIAFALIGLWMLKSDPVWYQPNHLNAQQSAVAAKSMEDKLVTFQNWARAGTTPQITIEITGDELTSFSAKWAEVWKDRYGNFMTDPRMYLHDSTLIIAGRLTERNILASLHLDPRITDAGTFQPNLLSVRGGMLALPDRMLNKPKQKAIADLQAHLPELLRRSKLNKNGTANEAMALASAGQWVLAMLKGDAAEPYLYIPNADTTPSSSLVKLKHIRIDGTTLKIDAERPTPADRSALLDRMQSSTPR
jgi:hypothetical protein